METSVFECPVCRAALAAPGRKCPDCGSDVSPIVEMDALPEIFISQGGDHLGNGDFGRAEAFGRMALELCPDHPEALGLTALALEARDRPEEALDFWQDLIREHPDHALARRKAAALRPMAARRRRRARWRRFFQSVRRRLA